MKFKYIFLVLLMILVGLIGFYSFFGQEPPYPASPIITEITWDYDSLKRSARESDLFPMTWADDDNLYTAWGDGWGFSESGRKCYLGVSRVSGFPPNHTGVDLWSTRGKCNGGIISIDGSIYIFVQEQGKWERCKLWKSTDHGRNWADLGWIFEEQNAEFASPGLIQFSSDYSDSRDNYVYGYGRQGGTGKELFLFRVPKDRLGSRNSYEFFTGVDGKGNPTWSLNIVGKEPVFIDPNGVLWGVNACFHPVSKRYLLTVRHDESGGWGIFDAPEPWGPWTTVAYYNNWVDTKRKITFVFNQKWMSSDGKAVWMVFTGPGENDAFNVIRGTINFLKTKD